MAYVTEMVRFPNGRNKPVRTERLAGNALTIEEAAQKGKARIATSSLGAGPIGFQVIDAAGMTLKIWQVGDDD